MRTSPIHEANLIKCAELIAERNRMNSNPAVYVHQGVIGPEGLPGPPTTGYQIYLCIEDDSYIYIPNIRSIFKGEKYYGYTYEQGGTTVYLFEFPSMEYCGWHRDNTVVLLSEFREKRINSILKN
jgi:hypothetical protein